MCLGKGTEFKSCTGATLLKEHNMKKTIIATLLILLIASASIFAVADSFNVTTTVGEIGLMKVSSAEITGNTSLAYTNSGDFTELVIENSGAQTFEAYLTTLSNKRSGYEVTMKATPMTSAATPTTYIDYTVGCGTGTITTTGATTPATAVTIIDIASLTELTGASKAITLSVDSATFEAAVSGSYTGTVTFNYTAT